MPLLLTNQEVAAAMSAAEYVEVMEQVYRELGANRAVNSRRVDTCFPVDQYTPATREAVDAMIAALPLDADPVTAPAVLAAGKATGKVTYRLKTVTGGAPLFGVAAVRISTHFDTQPEVNGMPRRVKLPLGPGWRFMSMVVLLSLSTGEVLGMLPDSHIQKMRVGGTTGVGVKLMAREDARVLGILGSGAQAEAALECAITVRAFGRVLAYSPTPESRARFARKMAERTGLDVVATDTPEAVFAAADVVLTNTSSYVPVFRPEWLREGMHLGTCTHLEDDPASFPRSPSVVVSLRPLGEDSDFVMNYVMGERTQTTFGEHVNRRAATFPWSSMIELGEMLVTGAGQRRSRGEITHHLNNTGCGMQFAAAGARILENARRRGLGTELPGDFFLQKEHT